jgi:hypothetical protein
MISAKQLGELAILLNAIELLRSRQVETGSVVRSYGRKFIGEMAS